MSDSFPCPYFNAPVILSGARAQHIIETHPGTWPDYREEIQATLANPEFIWESQQDPDATLLARWFSHIRTGRYIVIVVISPPLQKQHWIITAYTARKIPKSKTHE